MSAITSAIIETTNACNGACQFCPRRFMTRPVQNMSMEQFNLIINKLSQVHIKVLTLYAFGEPLMDAELFDKYRLARELDVLDKTVALNTNGSLLTEGVWQSVLDHTNEITISIFHSHKDYEDLTGLNWDVLYNNVAGFINYRNEHRKDYKIRIGINSVQGYNKEKVRETFSKFNVEFLEDTGVFWGKDEVRVLRSGRRHDCDIRKGIMTIRSNGDCSTCCYDYDAKNVFGNIFTDSIEELEKKAKANFPLCKRCDFK